MVGIHLTGKALFEPGRYDEILDVCSANPEWKRLLAKEFPADAVLQETLRLRHPSFDGEEEYLIRIDKPEFPRRPWFTYRFVPKLAA